MISLITEIPQAFPCISSQIEPRIEEFVHLNYPAMTVKQQGKTMKQMWLLQTSLRMVTGRNIFLDASNTAYDKINARVQLHLHTTCFGLLDWANESQQG